MAVTENNLLVQKYGLSKLREMVLAFSSCIFLRSLLYKQLRFFRIKL